MFDLSLGELGLIALVALLVLGPERLPKAARTVGFYVRKARQSWFSVRAEFERELAADELKRSLKLDEMHATLDQTAKDLRGELEQASSGIKSATLPAAVSSTSPEAVLDPHDDGLTEEERARQVEALPFEAEPDENTAIDGRSDEMLVGDAALTSHEAAAPDHPDFVIKPDANEVDESVPNADAAQPGANEPAR